MEIEEIEAIKNHTATKTAAKNKGLICSILMNGGCTKAFKTRDELARCICGIYHDRWQRHIRTVTEDDYCC